MAWKEIAQGDSLDNVQGTVPNFDLPKGTPVKFTLKLNMPVANLFNAPFVESLFGLPEGLEMVDVHAEGWWTVIVNAKANSPTLAAILAFIKAYWVAILIAGFVLAALVVLVSITADIVDLVDPANWLLWVVIAGAVYFGFRALTPQKKRSPP